MAWEADLLISATAVFVPNSEGEKNDVISVSGLQCGAIVCNGSVEESFHLRSLRAEPSRATGEVAHVILLTYMRAPDARRTLAEDAANRVRLPLESRE